ncbi:MAG: hypothetical protein HS108_13465 [Planctomycetes bacterium]|jgi:hypothetical protein|nr:hypothetical protein [Planctomycetota bacterium]MCL4730178.1 hypothetical protein [Planctomycetota bacterium]
MPTVQEALKTPLAGDYQTCGLKKPFHVLERDGDIHCFVGFRNKTRDFDNEANVVLWEKDRLITEAVAFIERLGEVRLGPCREETIPEPDTLEEFLRSFSIHGNLASYFPPILEKLGLVEVFKKGRALYVKRKTDA